jgi:signal transduction histidine kinase/DNA-binding response OmpR family regulator
MSGRFSSKFNSWVINSIYHPGDSEETIVLKRIYWISIHFIVLFLSLFIPVFYFYGLTNWLVLAFVYIGFHIINLAVFYIVRRGIRWFALSTQIAHMIISFVMVVTGGGILHSGGAVFIGLVGPFLASIFQNKRAVVIFVTIYLLAVIIEAVLQPYLAPYQPFTPGINIFFFLTLFFTVVIVFFTALMYYTNQTNKLKEAETIRLRKLDEAKTKLYTNISHEFRTPLTIILGLADQISENSALRPDEGLQMIKRNGMNLLHLINQFLDLSKIEAKAMDVNFFQGEITGYLNYIFQSFYSLAKSKNISFNFLKDIDQLVMDFDPEKMMQIISNLLSNAIKYTPEGGDIEMIVNMRQKYNTRELIIKVRDNGIGIPADRLPRIFDRFYKVDDDHFSSSGGTGIGLSIVKELVAILKGTVSVQSEIPGGTEFTIVLPVTNQSEVKNDIDFELYKSDNFLFTSGTPKDPVKKGIKNRITKNMPKLIIVEDNPDVARYIESILRQDYNIKIAANGQEGLDLALKIIPDLVISDVMMSVMNGFVLCEKLKTDERTSHIPVILLTAMASEANKLEGLETGADAYLVKPFNTKELQIRVEKLIEQRRKLRERFSRDITLSPKEIVVTSVDERFLNRALEVIEKHMSDPDFGVDVFGKEVAMSHSHLYRKIHALTNQSPVELIRSIRLKHAASLLKQNYGSISEIAYKTGFNSPSYFTECFQKQFGKSPSEFITPG